MTLLERRHSPAIDSGVPDGMETTMRPLGYALLLAPLLLGLAGEPAHARDNSSRDISKRCNSLADSRDLDGRKRRDFVNNCVSQTSRNDRDRDRDRDRHRDRDRDRDRDRHRDRDRDRDRNDNWFGFGSGSDRPPSGDKTDWCTSQARQKGITGTYARNNFVKQCKNRG